MRVLILFLALFASTAFGQSDTAILDSACEPPGLRCVVEPARRLTSRIVFVVDVSGSMKGRPIATALSAVASVLEQPLDDLEVAVLAFSEGVDRWPGEPADELPPGWGRLPCARTLASIQTWLNGRGVSGGTNPNPALGLALGEPGRDLSVVLVTDGVFDQPTASIAVVQAALERRQDDQPLLMVYGVGKASASCPWLKAMAEMGGGGFFVEE